MAAGAIQLTIEQSSLARLEARIKLEENGAKLRSALVRDMRSAVSPAVKEVKSGAAQISHGGLARGSAPGGDYSSLGDAIARGISQQVRLVGPRVGITIRASKKGMPRGFRNAPQRMNRKSFNHPVFGRKVWVTQVGNSNYFDGPLKRDKPLYRAAIVAVMEEMAARIAK